MMVRWHCTAIKLSERWWMKRTTRNAYESRRKRKEEKNPSKNSSGNLRKADVSIVIPGCETRSDVIREISYYAPGRSRSIHFITSATSISFISTNPLIQKARPNPANHICKLAKISSAVQYMMRKRLQLVGSRLIDASTDERLGGVQRDASKKLVVCWSWKSCAGDDWRTVEKVRGNARRTPRSRPSARWETSWRAEEARPSLRWMLF